MRINTEQTLALMTSAEGKKIIDMISPIYQDGPIALSLINAIGDELDELDQWINQLWDEINPLTATWSLNLWEKEYGLPTNPSMSYEQRRGRLVRKMMFRAPMSPHRMESIVTNICKRSSEVIENTGYRKFSVNIYPGESIINYEELIEAINESKKSQLYFDLFITKQTKLEMAWRVDHYVFEHIFCNEVLSGQALCGAIL